MVQIKAHFDGKVFVPDEPLNLRRDQRVVMHIEPVDDRNGEAMSSTGTTHRDRVLSMVGWARDGADNAHSTLDNVTDDQLWGG